MKKYISNSHVVWAGLIASAVIGIAAIMAIPAEAAPSDTRTKTVRTLEAINIEGEIAVPQVLFITSRDFRRFRDGLVSKYRVSALDVARSFDLPTRLRIVAQPVKLKEEGK